MVLRSILIGLVLHLCSALAEDTTSLSYQTESGVDATISITPLNEADFDRLAPSVPVISVDDGQEDPILEKKKRGLVGRGIDFVKISTQGAFEGYRSRVNKVLEKHFPNTSRTLEKTDIHFALMRFTLAKSLMLPVYIETLVMQSHIPGAWKWTLGILFVESFISINDYVLNRVFTGRNLYRPGIENLFTQLYKLAQEDPSFRVKEGQTIKELLIAKEEFGLLGEIQEKGIENVNIKKILKAIHLEHLLVNQIAEIDRYTLKTYFERFGKDPAVLSGLDYHLMTLEEFMTYGKGVEDLKGIKKFAKNAWIEIGNVVAGGVAYLPLTFMTLLAIHRFDTDPGQIFSQAAILSLGHRVAMWLSQRLNFSYHYQNLTSIRTWNFMTFLLSAIGNGISAKGVRSSQPFLENWPAYLALNTVALGALGFNLLNQDVKFRWKNRVVTMEEKLRSKLKESISEFGKLEFMAPFKRGFRNLWDSRFGAKNHDNQCLMLFGL